MSGSPSIARIEAIPVHDVLAPADVYGSSRGLVRARAATLVRLETADGVVGWGEAWGASRATAVLVGEIAAELTGQRLEPSGSWFTRLLNQRYHHTSGGHHVAAAGAIDIAMWDALGRTLDVPVHLLLGGRTRDHLTPYASAGYITHDNDAGRFADGLRELAADGYRGVKIKLGLGFESDVARTRAAREILGPDTTILLDFNGNYTADQARRSIARLAEFAPGWIEEPVPPDDRSGWALLRECGVPLAAGEAVYTRYGFRDLIAGRVVDVVQPDVSKCGGLGEARVIAHLAQTWNVRFSPHVWGGVVAQAASVQLLASVPDYPHVDHAAEPLWLEYDRGRNALRDELAVRPFTFDGGVVTVPDGPGLGIEIDEAALDRLRADR
ncbi:mandelate racemase/muconate lactonizing enzyme family protein [Jiangella gansuensis]|uniref:mandelate racemase/muconate lactonizing enzyme family protein n=1 Tax=Jiangella gansuensis TaxID=281473 RepID=UPI0004B5F4DE|nr:mandelate racemase/muconate lactonizing enzyme family protein [Jiangella gansuensis]